ncbi:MAG: S8 family serine peptidase [Clostridia bacterium]|nr:S8 family serine peptidase [Clostridia bacterium]
MLIKFVSVLMSIVISVTGFAMSSFSSFIDTAAQMLFGVPYTSEAVEAEFFNEIDDGDITEMDEVSGFVKNKLIVFLDESMKFSQKVEFFAGCKGLLVGWCTPADLYVLRYPAMTYEELMAECAALDLKDGVALAMPVFAEKTDENETPDDDFGFEFSDIEWDENLPGGRNWWLEAINARQAWDYSDRFSTVNIGVVDSGFELDHPELEGKISFPNEKQAKRNNEGTHGTHVAGIIAAEKNNKTGISGICSNSKLICVDWSPEGLQLWNTSLAVLFGFSAVVKAGAKAVNFSMGISSGIIGTRAPWANRVLGVKALTLSMASLLKKGYDFVAIQSAGNGNTFGLPIDSINNGHFSSVTESNIFTGFTGVEKSEILDRIIIVAAAKNDGDGTFTQTDYTNVGSHVSIAAPGDDIYSCDVNSDYCYLSGTSMAAPVVTAVASLVWSVNPNFSGAEVKKIVCTSTDKIAQINYSIAYLDGIETMDYPMVNAKLAVEEAIKLTDSTVGTLEGNVYADGAAAVEFGEKRYTVLPDGSFSFVAPEGEGTLNVLDNSGNVIASIEAEIIAGETVNINKTEETL